MSRQSEKGIFWIGIISMGLLLCIVTYLFFFTNHTIQLPVSWKTDAALYHKIQVAYELQDYPQSWKLMREFLTDYSDSPWLAGVYAIAADLYYQKTNYDAALTMVEKGIDRTGKQGKEYIAAIVVLGKIALAKDRYDAVTIHYLEDAYLKAESGDKQKLAIYLGYASLFQKDYMNALRYFNSTVGEYSVVGRTRVYVETGKYAEAIQEYVNYFTLYPKGQVYEGMKKAYLKQALYYADQLIAAKLPIAATTTLSNLTQLFPQEDSVDLAWVKIAQVLELRKSYLESLSALNKGLQNNTLKWDDALLYQKGQLLYTTANKKEALGVFRELSLKYPQSIYWKLSQDWIKLISKDLAN